MKPRCALVSALFAIGCGSSGGDLPPPKVDASAQDATPSQDAATDAPAPPPPDAGDAGDAGDGGARPGLLVAYASGYAPNITLYTVDPKTGALASRGTTASIGSSPSFLAINRAATTLYALDEATAGRVGAFAIDRATGSLTHLNDVSSQGNGPAHVSVDATGKFVFVANYGDGTVAVLSVQPDGRLGGAVDTQKVGANAHMIVADPSNQFVFVPCKGADYVAQFRFDAATGKLTPNAPPHVTTATGAGPRHIAFHPNGKLAYLINENDSTMTALSLDVATGRLTAIETKSTLPAGFTGANTGAEVWVDPSGRYVYGSNRGDDSIVVFGLDAATGKMTLASHTKTGGATPRDFTLDPTGAFLYAANQGTNGITLFDVEGATGALTAAAGSSVAVTAPTFIGIVRLPGM